MEFVEIKQRFWHCQTRVLMYGSVSKKSPASDIPNPTKQTRNQQTESFHHSILSLAKYI